MKGFALRSLLTIGCIAALSDAFATDEVVAGISEMMAIDRSSGHEWSVFWKMVDTELTFDMYVHMLSAADIHHVHNQGCKFALRCTDFS